MPFGREFLVDLLEQQFVVHDHRDDGRDAGDDIEAQRREGASRMSRALCRRDLPALQFVLDDLQRGPGGGDRQRRHAEKMANGMEWCFRYSTTARSEAMKPPVEGERLAEQWP